MRALWLLGGLAAGLIAGWYLGSRHPGSTAAPSPSPAATPALAPSATATDTSAATSAVDTAAADDERWWGAWERDANGFHAASLEIRETTERGFRFRMDAMNGGNIGEVAGEAVLAGPDAAVFTDTADGGKACRLEMRRRRGSGANLTVTASEGCQFFAGYGVDFGGEFEKRHDGVARTGLLSDAELSALYRAMGARAYDALVGRFQLVGEAEPAEGGGRAFSGYVRGLALDMNGIVGKERDGEVWAAYVDGDTVRFFTTRGNRGTEMPSAVERWRSDFREKPVAAAAGEARGG